ncbi:methyl-accepting chemotaxis protein [Paenibacillus sp. NPDC056722]|uniref:methyl-accepting chemotaxis protein n=1 Tax=Paenibacillus sp. NPDC056722 TaxID=3345924 RepID=UPI0036CF844C
MKRSWIIRFKSVGMKLFLIVFCSIVLLSTVLGLTSYYTAKGIIMDEVAAASGQSIVQAADKLDFLLAEYEALSRQFAVDPVLKADSETANNKQVGTVSKAAAEDRIRRKLDSVRDSDKRMAGIRLLSKSLIDVDSYKSTGTGAVRSDEGVAARVKQIEDAKGNPVWFPVREKGFFDVYSEPSLTMGRLLRNMQHPEAEYYMLIEVKGSAITSLLDNLQIGAGGEIRIVTPEGGIVYATDSKLLGQEAFIKVPDMSKGRDKPDAAGVPQLNHSFTAADEQGQSQLVVYQPLGIGGWTMMGYAPVSDFTSSANKLLYITLSVVLAAGVVAVLIGYLLLRLVGKPLGKLVGLMEEGEKGNLQVRTNFKSQDEIGRLGHSFNRMMEQISRLADQSRLSADGVLSTSAQLVKVSGTISLHAREVAAATSEIAGGAASLAAEAERGHRNVEVMGEKMQEVTDLNATMDSSTGKIVAISGQGSETMRQLVEQSESVLNLMNLIQENSAKLRESTHLIRSILSPMIAVNKQTNILALNASIEAVRAGEAGRGFLVIADEIRQLANQSNQSIQSVSQITEEIGQNIENTVTVVNEAAPLFGKQIASVRESSAIFDQVRSEMEQFLGHITNSTAAVNELIAFQRQLGDAMGNVSAVVQQSNASTQEVASMSTEQSVVSEELVALSGKLEGLAEELKKSLVSFQGSSAGSLSYAGPEAQKL